MAQVAEADVLQALSAVMDPDLHRDIVSLGFVKDVRICGGHIAFKVELTTPACPVKDLLRDQAHAQVAALEGVEKVEIEMTAQVRAPEREGPLAPGIAHVIAVASGKGGVGKSTVACNLAVALAQSGARVGLLDADIYGPSIPMMMGTSGEQPAFENQKIVPVERHGVHLMSIGFFLEADKAVVWRGPMIGKALQQFLGDVEWGTLDYLVVDLPPGTGDAPMSLAQLMQLTGVVVVMTPQDVAREIANKSILMFRQLEQSTGKPIPILGVVENMSGYILPSGEEVSIFGKGGGKRAAEELGVPFLGSVPIDPAICEAGDIGIPAILTAGESVYSRAFSHIAGQVAARISTLTR